METHIKQFDSTAIIIVEISEEGKSPETKYITIGTVGKASEADLGMEALSYLKDVKGQKIVREVIYSDSEQYRQYLEKAINDFSNQ